jgi:hypothetical protein
MLANKGNGPRHRVLAGNKKVMEGSHPKVERPNQERSVILCTDLNAVRTEGKGLWNQKCTEATSQKLFPK